jgi:hypothetical protein
VCGNVCSLPVQDQIVDTMVPTPLTRGIVFHPLKERGRGGGAPLPLSTPPPFTLLVTLVTPHVNDLPPLFPFLPPPSLATVQRNNSSTVNKKLLPTSPVNMLYHLYLILISRRKIRCRDLTRIPLLPTLVFMYNIRFCSTWFPL